MVPTIRSALVGSIMAAALTEATPFYANTTTPGVTVTTEVVTAITTYCPAPTTLTFGPDKTYTVTEETTLTITDCPCTITHPVGPTPTPPAEGDECAKKCNEEHDKCLTAPDANHAYCASQFAACLGFNPYNDYNGPWPPVSCAPPANNGTAPPPPHGNGTHTTWTTEVVTAITTYCPAPTTVTWDDHTYTVSEPTTLTITDCPCTISHPIPPPAQPTSPVSPPEQPPANPPANPPVSSPAGSPPPAGTPPPAGVTTTPVAPVPTTPGATPTGPETIPTAAAGALAPLKGLVLAGLGAVALL